MIYNIKRETFLHLSQVRFFTVYLNASYTFSSELSFSTEFTFRTNTLILNTNASKSVRSRATKIEFLECWLSGQLRNFLTTNQFNNYGTLKLIYYDCDGPQGISHEMEVPMQFDRVGVSARRLWLNVRKATMEKGPSRNVAMNQEPKVQISPNRNSLWVFGGL